MVMHVPSSAPCTVRQAVEADIPAIAEIEKACFSDPWSAGALHDTLNNPLAVLLCAMCEGTLAGYVGVYLIGEDADITNVAVLPQLRRRGIADALLDALLVLCRAHGVHALHLEVRASNLPALTLYEKHGFLRECMRRGYYRSPKEDAVLMTLAIL